MAAPLANLNSNNLTTAPDGTKLNTFWTNPSAPATASNVETSAVKKARAAKVAKSRLKKKNRKRHKKNLVLAFNPMIESGTVYTTKGFSPDFDGNWLVTLVTHHFVGKSGSTTTLELEKSIVSY